MMNGNSYYYCLKLLLVLIAGLFFINDESKAQFFDTGQDPFSIKWKQINTDKFQLIFPSKFEPKARHLAGIFDKAYKPGSFSLNNEPGKISILLHDYSVISNGMVAWAPKRMELYSMPPQDNLSSEWFNHLLIHEFRHLVQIDKLNQGFTKTLGYLAGQQAAIAVVGLHIPLWFMEGDAVTTETALTNSGRGRDPSFEMKLRAQLLEKSYYKYDKAVFGSYKNYTPNHYTLGYYIVANTRSNFGTSIWDNTLNHIARNPFKIAAFSNGVKKFTGYSKTELYKSNMEELKRIWSYQDWKTVKLNGITLNKEKDLFTNYSKAYYIDNDNYIVEKTGLDDIDRFVQISKKDDEKIVFTPGQYFRGSLNFKNDLLVWTEIQEDIRWDHLSYSVIKSYNLQEKKYKQLTNKSRLFSPSLSPDAQKIAAVEVDLLNHCNIVIINSKTGSEIDRIDIPENLFVMTPCWNSNGHNIVVVLQNEKGKSLGLIKLKNKTITYLTDFSFTEISNPVISGFNVLFTGAWSGIDNIYLLDLLSGRIKKISSVQFGAEYPAISPDGKKYIYSSYNSMGYNLVEASILKSHTTDLNDIKNNSARLYDKISQQEKYEYNPASIDSSTYKIENYSRIRNLFNLHSWAPLGIDASNYSVEPGVSIMSQNILGTMFAGLGYGYNLNEETGRYFANISYMGFYPAINMVLGAGQRKTYHTNDENIESLIRWKEKGINLNISQPLILTRNKYYRGLRPGISINYKNIKYLSDKPEDWYEGNLISTGLSFMVYNQLKRSSRDIYPKFGQVLSFNYKNIGLTRDLTGSLFSSELAFFFPGFFKHHGFRIYSAFQKKVTTDYTFMDLVVYPRSFHGNANEKLYSIKFDYKFPLFYPDFSIFSLLYLKRIKLNLFNDYATGTHEGDIQTYWSSGIELSSDMHLFRFKAPFDLGFRLSYQHKNEKLKFEILYQVDLYAIR